MHADHTNETLGSAFACIPSFQGPSDQTVVFCLKHAIHIRKGNVVRIHLTYHGTFLVYLVIRQSFVYAAKLNSNTELVLYVPVNNIYTQYMYVHNI